MPPYLPSGYAFEIVIYARRRLRHPRLGFEKRRVEMVQKERESESVYPYARVCMCVCSITVTRPRRSSFNSDEHKSPVMTDRCRSDPSYARPTAMPATARKCQGVGEALRKNFSPRIEISCIYGYRRVECLLSLPTTRFYDNRYTSGSRKLVFYK